MGSDHSSNITVGKPVDDNSYTNLDMVRAIVSQMKVLSGQWDAENKSEAENDALHDKASAPGGSPWTVQRGGQIPWQ